MAMQFGKTWWGEHWLRSLENVDYDNRLPRGATYARRGNVVSIKIKDNRITAKVSGSRKTPYTVNVIIPPFFEEDIDVLMTKIIERPALISKLLNRELDPSILDIANEVGLRVFPKQWTDFKMQCSCPDWAVPCKHLASVIYMVSREIDNNPFLVFEIHKVKLLEELKKRGIFIADQKKTEILSLDKILKTKRPKKSKKAETNKDTVYEMVDFSQLENMTEALVQLLPDEPPFYPSGNFKLKYSTQIVRISKVASRILNKNLDFEMIFSEFAQNKELGLSNRTKLGLQINNNNQIFITGQNHNLSQIEQLIPALFRLNPDMLRDFEASVVAFHKLLLAAIHLMAKGLIIPQIIKLENTKFAVRWLPAMIDNRVKTVIAKLNEIIPQGLLLTNKTANNEEEFLQIKNQTVELLSIFINALLVRLSKDSNSDLYEDLFFKNKNYGFTEVGENAISGGIKVWLDRYHLTSENYKPVIIISELPNEKFDVEISIDDTSKLDELPIPLNNILKEKQYAKQRFKILQSLSLLSPFIRGIDNYINMGGITPVRFNNDEFAPLLIDILPAIRLLDINIVLPKSLEKLLRPKVSVKLERSQEAQGYIRLDELLSFNWQIAIGDTLISQEEFNKLLEKASRLFKFKGDYIYVSDADIEKLHKALTDKKPLNSYQLLQTALSEEYQGAPISLSDDVRNLINELTTNETIPLPAGLNAELRPYQLRGYSWMYKNSRIGFGSIIADDMGLGKTIQVISVLLKYKEEKAINDKQKALVVVPTGLLINWQAEIERFAPSLSTHIFHGSNRNIKDFDADIMLTTYGILRSDVDLLKKQKWQIMVIDEAQNIKNHVTAQSKAIKSISSNIRIAMSGTPVENRLTEFWSIMDYVNKAYLGNVKSFKTEYANPIQMYNDEQVAAKFRKITQPFMMRRMKTDKTIISDLPDKIEQNQFALLTKQQASLYEKTMHLAMDEIEGCSTEDNKSLFKRQGLVLQMIMALKQICNHPTQFLKNKNLEASISGKTELLLELLDSIIESGEKVLVFTQFKEMGLLLEHFIQEKFGEKPMFYHGGSSVKQRQEMVNNFQNNKADKIFLLSLKAAGTGLNLTAASHVIHYDLWWNPAVENQATDRAYRIGQDKNVMVHRLITKNTFEERIDEMIQKKKHLSDMTVASGENWIGKLSNKELREIFK